MTDDIIKAITITTYCNAVTQMNRTPEIGALQMAEILRQVAIFLENEAKSDAQIALLIAKIGEYREPLS